MLGLLTTLSQGGPVAYRTPVLTDHGKVTFQTACCAYTSSEGLGFNFARGLSTDAADKSEPTRGDESSGET